MKLIIQGTPYIAYLTDTFQFPSRYNFDDAEFTSMMDKVQFIATNFSFAAPQNFIPAMKVFPLPKNVSFQLSIEFPLELTIVPTKTYHAFGLLSFPA